MTAQLVVIPGWFGSGAGHWQRWLADQVPGALILEQDDWQHPKLDPWLRRLDEAIEASPRRVVLAAHSLGVILVAHHAIRHSARKIAGALLVAPGDADLRSRYEPEFVTFAPVPRRPLPYPAILVGSRSDEYMTVERSAELAADLGARFVDLGDAGHINIASGYGPFPLALELLSELMGQGIEHPEDS